MHIFRYSKFNTKYQGLQSEKKGRETFPLILSICKEIRIHDLPKAIK